MCAKQVDPSGQTASLVRICEGEYPPRATEEVYACYEQGSPEALRFLWCLKANKCTELREKRAECFVPLLD
jgi:hypothetical protein